jgi:hypothetical protein
VGLVAQRIETPTQRQYKPNFDRCTVRAHRRSRRTQRIDLNQEKESADAVKCEHEPTHNSQSPNGMQGGRRSGAFILASFE